MKKISLLLSFVLASVFAFGQSITLVPGNSGSEVIVTKFSNTPEFIGRRASGTATSPAATVNAVDLSYVGGAGYNGTSFTTIRAWMAFRTTQSWASGANGTKIVFATTPNNTTLPIERMTLDEDGNLGIGIASPVKKLHVYSGSSGVGSFASTSSLLIEDNVSHYIQMGAPNTEETGVLFGKPSNSASGGVVYDGNNNLTLRTGGNINRIVVTSGGNVGIGATTPTAKLDVDGDIVVRKTTISSAGTYNALNRGGGSSVYFSVTGTVTLNGIAGGQDGMILYLFTASNTTLNIVNVSGSASAANQIATHTGANVTISGRGGATLIYSSDTSNWRIVGVAQ